MDFYADANNVEQYISMAAGYDGRYLIDILMRHLPAGATVLEIGMGPGVDLEMLAEHYAVTGSDRSTLFLERFRRRHPDADLLQLDAVDLDTDRCFDAIYSNKVLHHLTPAELTASLDRQAAMLTPGGFAMHSFWAGEGEEEMQGMRFTYHSCASLTTCVGTSFTIITCEPYREMDDQDSLYILLQKP